MIQIIDTKKLPQRIIAYVAGLMILAFGVAFSINSDLGVSPVSSVPYVVSYLVSALSVGNATTAIFVIFIIMQILILRKDYKWFNLTQILFAAIFGFFLDFAQWVMGDLQFPTYAGRLGMLAISIVLIAIGIVFIMAGRLAPLPPEGFAQSLETRFERVKFHVAKMAMDSGLVIIALALSLVFLGRVIGVREGTVISAIAIGKIIPFIRKMLRPILAKLEPDQK
ncbi:MAG: DUF6198 family protein [Defluviitaleaceae bacterium]|nr:DUF6198 family protein [Defluviitaleaceae bacterium]